MSEAMDSLLTPCVDNTVALFMEIVAVQSVEKAVQCLKATEWKLEEAINLYYSGKGPKRNRHLGARSKQKNLWESNHNSGTTSHSEKDLSSIYRKPNHLMYRGTFDEAKIEASRQEKWLIANVQSTEEFSSHMLNRDTWSHESVGEMIRSSFIFWQVHHDSHEGSKVCSYYDLVSLPAILVIDPTTGQRMCKLNGMVQPDDLLERLLPFMDRGPKEHGASLSHGRPREDAETFIRIPDKMEDSLSGKMENLTTCSMSNNDAVEDSLCEKMVNVTTGSMSNDDEAATTKDKETRPLYLPLPEEPKGDAKLLCGVAIRLPDGRRLKRNFLATEPVKLLWSFCCSHLEGGDTHRFRFLMQSTPGVPKSLEYESNLTFEESGLSNSLISLTWE